MKKLIGQKCGSQKYSLSFCKGAKIRSTRPSGQKTWVPSESGLSQMLPMVDENCTYNP